MLAKPKRGQTLQVALGFLEFGGAVDRGTYIVQGVSKLGGPAEFHVTAQSADLKKTLKQQKTRAWVAPKTLGDVLNQVASDNGLAPAIDAGLAATPIDTIIAQTGESDMHLVMRLARRYGAVAKFASGRLVFVPQGAGTTASGAAFPTLTITPNDCEKFGFHDNDREVRGKSKSRHWDRKTATATDYSGDAGDGGPDYAHPETFGSKTEAQRSAKARAKAFARAKKTMSAELRAPVQPPVPGGVVTTEGFGDDDDCDWIAKSVIDEFDDKGLVSAFEGELKV
jgi:phage protein D